MTMQRAPGSGTNCVLLHLTGSMAGEPMKAVAEVLRELTPAMPNTRLIAFTDEAREVSLREVERGLDTSIWTSMRASRANTGRLERS